MLPTFPFVETKLCFLSNRALHFNLSLWPPHQLRIKEPGERKEPHTICDASDHKLELSLIAFKREQSTVGGAMWLKKMAVTCGHCNYCTATSSQWALSDSHCPLLCTSHPGKTNIHERNLEGIGVCCLSGSKFKSSDQSTFVWPM